jgi:CDGSH-type Zn-finger protein
MSEKKTQIIFTKSSPLYLVNGESVNDEMGKAIAVKPVTALCRCGKSLKMPYCDDTHIKEPFNNEKLEGRHLNKWRSYEGQEITIHFNLGICCHVGLCLKNLPSVFSKDTKPWINPNGASAEAIIAMIKTCPSGALTYSIAGDEVVDFDDEVHIKIVTNGPIVVRGSVELIDEDMSIQELKSKERYTLCRCGKSKNKPFCDGSHRPEE